MANKKISELTAATALTGVEEIPVVQSGVTKKMTLNQVRTPQGHATYDNAGSEQAITADVFLPMTNDTLASTTFIDELPEYSTALFASNRIDLDGIGLNSPVTLRLVVELNTLTINTEFDVKLVFRSSSESIIFESQIGHTSFKNTGARTFTFVNIFFVGSAILNGTVELQVKADKNAGATYKGVLIIIP